MCVCVCNTRAYVIPLLYYFYYWYVCDECDECAYAVVNCCATLTTRLLYYYFYYHAMYRVTYRSNILPIQALS